ncbi:MAG: precorrin-4 C(11)-methyltransferase [Desulfobacterota bacterium]|nr:precorrin-4 C(11)-methyltransferase [Thermodesulfobacteriota bacterium]
MKQRSLHGSVYFIGAGPGNPDLLTIAAQRIIKNADCIIYAGSLVHPDIIRIAKKHAVCIDSATRTLDEIIDCMVSAARRGNVVARIHSGDPSLFGAIAEQMRMLDKHNIPYAIIPGVSSVFAAAAAIGIEYTVPGGTQTLILTRRAGRTPVPSAESLRALAAHRSSLAIFLSVDTIDDVVKELIDGGAAPRTPVAVVYRVSWPDQMIIRGTLASIARKVRTAGISRQALILVGDALRRPKGSSRLYAQDFTHTFRADPRSRTNKLAILAVTRQGVMTGKKILEQIHKAELYVPERLRGLLRHQQVHTYRNFQATVQEVFKRYQRIVFITATGIAVRALAPLLGSKWEDPAVVVMDDCGRIAISLLSGHWGGANNLAAHLARTIGAQPIITTASDTAGFPALDLLVQRITGGVVPDNPEKLRHLQTALCEGCDVGFYPPELCAYPGLSEYPWAHFYSTVHDACTSRCSAVMIVSPYRENLTNATVPCLHVVPRTIAIGIGCHRGVSEQEVASAIATVCRQLRLDERSIAAVCTIDRRATEPGLKAYCKRHGYPLKTFSVSILRQVGGLQSVSEHALRKLGVMGVAEPCAVLGADGGKLLLPKQKVGHLTIAVAQRSFHTMFTEDGDKYEATKR